MAAVTTKNEDRYDDLFKLYAEKWGVSDWCLLKAQAIAESNLDPNAVSPVGAVGLAQFMLPTWEEIWLQIHGEDGSPLGDRTNPEYSIELQAKYMHDLLAVFHEVNCALAAYNWGWGKVQRHLAKYAGTLNREALPLETQGYLANIETIRKRLPLA
jgi:membrane-bound lytic murein transglycosylase D